MKRNEPNELGDDHVDVLVENEEHELGGTAVVVAAWGERGREGTATFIRRRGRDEGAGPAA